MKSLLHWFAAAWVLVVSFVLAIGMLTVICYLAYIAFTEAWSFIAIGACFFVFLWSCHWAGGYIDDHGWPWKPKHQSERADP